jgi:hypothetical protein
VHGCITRGISPSVAGIESLIDYLPELRIEYIILYSCQLSAEVCESLWTAALAAQLKEIKFCNCKIPFEYQGKPSTSGKLRLQNEYGISVC